MDNIFGFQSVFDGQMTDDVEFETMFGGDGDLIDMVAGIKEDGSSVLDADAESLHHNRTNAEPDDFSDELGEDHDTDNAPDEAEGSEPAADEALAAALGEADGNPTTSADHFYGKKTDSEPCEGRNEDPDEMNLDKETDSAIDYALGEGCGGKSCEEEGDVDDDIIGMADGQGVEESTDLDYESGDSDLLDEVINNDD